MDFELSEEMVLIQEMARDFAAKEIVPNAAEWDKNHVYPAETVKKAAELGFLGMMIPEKYGGTEMGSLALSIVIEQISQACASFGVILSVHNSLLGTAITKYGTDEQKSRYLPMLASGEALGAYALTEPGAGTDATNLKLLARKEGDRFILDGTKLFITNGAEAGLFVVFARTSSEEKKSHGISAFIVEPSFPGFSIGTHESKMGLRATSTVELIFEDCEVPATNLLGEEGKGIYIALDVLVSGRIGVASQSIGIAQACLDASIKYSQEREQFGRPIGDFQAVQWKIAEMATGIEASRLLVYKAACIRDAGRPCSRAASMAKLAASETSVWAANEAVQIHGGAGYTKEFPVERYFRDSRITKIYEGTSEAVKMVLARDLLE